MTLSNPNNNFEGGVDPAKPGDDRTIEQAVEPSVDPLGGTKIDHVILPNDTAIACNYCDLPAVGAVQVEDPNNGKGKQTFIRACAKHKSKALRESRRHLRRVYKKRVVIEHNPPEQMGAIDTSMGPDEVVTK